MLRALCLLALIGCGEEASPAETGTTDAATADAAASDLGLFDATLTDAAPHHLDAEPDAASDPGPDATPMLILGHRGIAWNHAGNPAPENTLLSVDLAGQAGADGVEIDVVKTADDVIVLRHDDQLATRTPEGISRSDCRGLITEATWAEIEACNAQAFDDEGLRAPLNRLEELLALEWPRLFVLDVKNDGIHVEPVRTVEVIAEAVHDFDAAERTLLMLYTAEGVAAASEAGLTACLKRHSAHELSRAEIADLALDAGAWGSCAASSLVNAELMEALEARTLKQVTFHISVTDDERFAGHMGRFADLGVYGVITDLVEAGIRAR